MNLLSLNDGHNSGASIFIKGKLICALSEERITRNKNEYGFPFHAINRCLLYANLKKNQIDEVAVSTKKLPPKYFLVKRNTTFSNEDYFKEQYQYWYKKIYQNKKIRYTLGQNNYILSSKHSGKNFAKTIADKISNVK